MTDLFNFNREDVLTLLTREHVKVGDKGYLGNNLKDLDTNVKHGEVHSLVSIYDGDFNLYPFESDHRGNRFALFLPVDKVKNKEPIYRPFKTFDELFNFLISDFDANDICDQSGNKVEIDPYEKAKILLGKKITLRCRENNFIKVMIITSIFYDNNNNDIYLNGNLVEYLFHDYEIQINGEFVPFGIKEE